MIGILSFFKRLFKYYTLWIPIVCKAKQMGKKQKLDYLKLLRKLFASHGFAGVTMRGVATMAQTNIASANYHFGTKEAMVLEMLKSKIEPINKKRKQRLAEAKHNSPNDPLTTSDIFRALILPVGEEVQKQFFQSVKHCEHHFS